MTWQWTPYTIPLIVVAAILTILALYIWRHRGHETRGKTAVLLLLAGAGWTLGYALEVGSANLASKVFWTKVQYLGIAIVPSAWLACALQYTGREKWLTRRTLALLSIVPLITLLLVFSNEAHGLMWSSAVLDPDRPHLVVDKTHGIGFWVFAAYSYTLAMFGFFLVMQMLVRQRCLYRRQISALLLAVPVLGLGSALDMFGLNRFPYLDPEPFTFAALSLIVTWGLYRLRLGDIVPVAHETTIEGMSDIIVVLDAQNRVVELNPAAQHLIGHAASEAIGQPVEQVWPDWPGSTEVFRDGAEVDQELVLSQGDEQRTYDLRTSLVVDGRGQLISRVVILRDISEPKRAEEALRKAHDELEERVQERTAELAEANEALRAQITERKRRTVELSTVLETTKAVSSTLDLEEVLALIAEQMVKATGVDGCVLSRWDQEADAVVTWIEWHRQDLKWADEPGTVHALDDFPAARAVLETRQPLIVCVSDPDADAAEVAHMRRVESTSLLMLPLAVGDKVVGLVELDTDEHERDFTAAEIRLCQALADQAAIAIENARLHGETQRRLQEQIALREAGTVISSTLDLETVLSRIAEQTGRAVDATSAYISVYEPETMTYTVLAEYIGSQACALEQVSDLGITYPEGDTEFEQTLQPGQHYIDHIDDPDLAELDRAHMQQYGAQTILYIPLYIRRQTIGYVEVWESRQRREFTLEEIALCKGIAQQAAIALENARLYEQAQQEIAERKRTEEALRKSEERYALAARGANDGLWDWDLKTNEVYFSPRWRYMLGYEENEIGNSLDEWFSRVHPKDLDQVKIELSVHIEGLTRHFEKEHRMLHKDGTYRWMLTRGLAVRDADGNAYRVAGSQTDITDRKRAEEQLLYDAFHDALTGLPNRALFMDRLGRSVERAKRREDCLFAVLFLDLDRFKNVNDSLGHTMGDELLIASARRLDACLRPSDTIARLGGDEFVILFEDIKDISDATRVTERIQEELALPFNLNGHEVFTSASIGIVLSETGYDRPEDILRDADIAMYRAKALGRARYELFDTAMRTRIMAHLELETDLRRAIEHQEFHLHYQPIVSLETGKITGFEALARWQHPDRGLVYPAGFIPVAEENRLIIPIDRWVLREACRQMREWQARFPTDPPLTISVNLSSRHFGQTDLMEYIEQILQETGLDASSLKLEMTESVIMADAESATATLTQLRALGVHVQIDDFGTGYSSLSYLQRLPVETIKIDRSFVSRMGVNGDNSGIVKTIVTLALDLGMDVIAEGVETAEQLAQLRALKCEYGQGYFISKPLDSEAAALIAEALAVERERDVIAKGVSMPLRVIPHAQWEMVRVT